jgi:hypothetical protein
MIALFLLLEAYLEKPFQQIELNVMISKIIFGALSNHCIMLGLGLLHAVLKTDISMYSQEESN